MNNGDSAIIDAWHVRLQQVNARIAFLAFYISILLVNSNHVTVYKYWNSVCKRRCEHRRRHQVCWVCFSIPTGETPCFWSLVIKFHCHITLLWCDFRLPKCTKFIILEGSALTPLGMLTALPCSWWGGSRSPLPKNPSSTLDFGHLHFAADSVCISSFKFFYWAP